MKTREAKACTPTRRTATQYYESGNGCWSQLTKSSHESKTSGSRSTSVSQEIEDIIREGEEVDYESDTVYSPKSESPPSREHSPAREGCSNEPATDDNIRSLHEAYSRESGIIPTLLIRFKSSSWLLSVLSVYERPPQSLQDGIMGLTAQVRTLFSRPSANSHYRLGSPDPRLRRPRLLPPVLV